MDRYDDLLIKAREEMMGKQPLRKGRDSKQLFSQVWEQVIKAPQNDPYGLMDSFAQQRQEQQRQSRGNFNTMAPQPADPFGQMNEGASLESAGQQPPTGMGANFSQGRSETRDPNKTGMFGRAKQGISNFMNRFRRQPAEQETAQGTVESASGSPPTMEERKPTREPLGAAESYRRTWGKEPDEQWLMQNDPEELQRRQAQQQEVRSTPPSIANKYRDQNPDSASSRLAEMREEMGGRTAPTTPSSMQSIYDRINNDMKPIEPQQTSPTEAGLNQMKITEFTEPQRDLDEELREMGFDSQGRRVEPPQEMEETEPMTDEPPQEMEETEPMTEREKREGEMVAQVADFFNTPTDEPSVDEMTTTQTGTRLPKGALPMKRRPESRMLPENVESREAQPMGGIKRRTFDEVNNKISRAKRRSTPRSKIRG